MLPSGEEDVRVIALNGPLPPVIDLDVDLLVEVRHSAGADTVAIVSRTNGAINAAPQSLGDVFDAAHRDTGQLHLNQRL